MTEALTEEEHVQGQGDGGPEGRQPLHGWGVSSQLCTLFTGVNPCGCSRGENWERQPLKKGKNPKEGRGGAP